MPFCDYKEFEFEIEDAEYPGERRKRVYSRGQGPGVLILHELPGLAPQTFELGDRIASHGYTVFLPLLFGEPTLGRSVNDQIRANLPRLWCVRREFNLWHKNRHSPVTDWLRALCRQIHTQCGGRGVGAIGMCLTGGLIIPLMVDEILMAPVLSEPSLPFGLSNSKKSALGVAQDELDDAKKNAARGVPVVGLRFEGDKKCPAERFTTLEREFGPQFHPFVIKLTEYEQHDIRRGAHSVLTYDFVGQDGHPTNAALNRVLAMLEKQLK